LRASNFIAGARPAHAGDRLIVEVRLGDRRSLRQLRVGVDDASRSGGSCRSWRGRATRADGLKRGYRRPYLKDAIFLSGDRIGMTQS
jgi:hypothetical protein